MKSVIHIFYFLAVSPPKIDLHVLDLKNILMTWRKWSWEKY